MLDVVVSWGDPVATAAGVADGWVVISWFQKSAPILMVCITCLCYPLKTNVRVALRLGEPDVVFVGLIDVVELISRDER